MAEQLFISLCRPIDRISLNRSCPFPFHGMPPYLHRFFSKDRLANNVARPIIYLYLYDPPRSDPPGRPSPHLFYLGGLELTPKKLSVPLAPCPPILDAYPRRVGGQCWFRTKSPLPDMPSHLSLCSKRFRNGMIGTRNSTGRGGS